MKSCHLQLVDGTRGYYAKRNESVREKKNVVWFHSYVEFDKHNRGTQEKGRKNKIRTDREANHKRLLNRTNWGLWRGGGWGDRLNGWWALRRALVGMSTGCCMEVMNHWLPLIFFFNFYLFLRERQSTSRGGAERGGDKESEAGSRLWAVSTEPDVGLELINREIMTWAENGRLTHWAPQVPILGSIPETNTTLYVN